LKTFLEPLTPDEEKIYIEKMRLGDKKAKDILREEFKTCCPCCKKIL
jgi:hypothetical protein